MTTQEKMIISAYTGILMVPANDFHKWIEERLGYPVWTHEFALQEFWEKIQDEVRNDFIDLCRRND